MLAGAEHRIGFEGVYGRHRLRRALLDSLCKEIQPALPIGRPAPSGAIDAIRFPRPSFSANEARRRIGRDADATQRVRNFLTPLA